MFLYYVFFFFNDTATTEIYTLSLHDALPISTYLSEQHSFPDLQNWEDSEKKIREAHISVERLRSYHKKQNEELADIKTNQNAKRKFSENQKASEFLESSEIIRKRIGFARNIQQERFKKDSIHTNAEMQNSHIKKYCNLTKEVEQILKQAGIKFQLSARSYMKMIKVARTIADLEGTQEINISHMAETLQYRSKAYEGI